MSIISKTYTFQNGYPIYAAEHNANFDTIYTDYDGNITNDNISASAGIDYTKLDLSGSIVNSDINTSAAIADTKLAQITTASKVSGTAITGLASTPSGAGALPIANGGTGQATAQLAINALTSVSSATNEYVLTKDTSTGNATFKVGNFQAELGNYLAYSNDDELSQVNKGSPTLQRSVIIPRSGALRIKFSGKGISGHHGYYRIYRSGVAVGTLNDNTTNNYVLYSEDITGWTRGELCQLYAWVDVTDGQYQYVKEFRIYELVPPDYATVT